MASAFSWEIELCIHCNGDHLMKRILVTCFVVSVCAGPCFAASPTIEAMIKTFQAVSTNAAKLKIFCEMKKVMDARGDRLDPAADAKIQGYMKQLGTDFQTAWVGSDDVDSGAPDGKALNAALDNLTGKCT
jgi:hypothetical protein